MKVEVTLDLKSPDDTQIIDYDDSKILYLDPREISFKEFSKDHKPGEYLYNILGMLHYKCASHPSVPVMVDKAVINEGDIDERN